MGYEMEDVRRQLQDYVARKGSYRRIEPIAKHLGVTRQHVTSFRKGKANLSYARLQLLGEYLDREGAEMPDSYEDPPFVRKVQNELRALLKYLKDRSEDHEIRLGVARSHMRTLGEEIDAHLGVVQEEQHKQEPSGG
jgi:transcriptional regulator with XRE-family HTH domain